jgi:hypothetical protein
MGLPDLTSSNFTSIGSLDLQVIVNNVVASIGMGEVALAHLMNAEGEKLQALLGTDGSGPSKIMTKQDLIDMNLSVGTAIEHASLYESSLTKKLNSVVASRNNLITTLGGVFEPRIINYYNLYSSLEDAVLGANPIGLASSTGYMHLRDLLPNHTYYLAYMQSEEIDPTICSMGESIVPDFKDFRLTTSSTGRIFNITAINAFSDPTPRAESGALDVRKLNFECTA